MIRLAATFLLLTFSVSIAKPCIAVDEIDANGDGYAMVSYTEPDGVDAISLRGPKSTLIASSLSVFNGAETITFTPHGKDIEMTFGAYIVRATELQFRTVPPIKNVELLEIK